MPPRRFRASLKDSRRSRRSQARLGPAFLWVLGAFSALWLAWVVFMPGKSGVLGAYVSGSLQRAVGLAAYSLPIFLGYALALYFKPGKPISRAVLSTGALLAVIAGASLVSLLGSWLDHPGWGGAVGEALVGSLIRVIGSPGAFLLSLVGLLGGLQLYFEISWKDVFVKIGAALREDVRAWTEARETLKESARKSVREGPEIRIPVPEAPVTEPPRIRQNRPQAATAPPAAAALPRRPDAPPYELPPLSLLKAPEAPAAGGKPTDEEIAHSAQVLEKTLANFSIEARVEGASPGPVITRYELSPAPGVKVSSFVSLSNDLALALKARSIRVIAPIPGKAAVGIEVPNPRPARVTLREILESAALGHSYRLPFSLGLTAEGQPIAADVSSMPHLLVAGATNSGKSVLIHDLILSILYRARPDEVKLLLIDPKRLELTFYEGIPHLYDPRTLDTDVRVITQPKEASLSLKKLVRVMELRYEKFARYGVRNIEGFNAEAAKRGEAADFYIVVVIDELADLMLTSQDVVEDSIQRLAQMARAVGIHLVLATQRPSVDVLTGVIKANLPVRVALQVISRIDSRVILDTQGAEALLGKGDMLYLAAGAQKPIRVQAPYVTEDEIRKVVEFVKAQGVPTYPPLETPEAAAGLSDDGKGANVEELVASLRLVQERRRVSQDLLKAHFGSSAKATDLLSLLEVRGFIHKPEGTNRWEISYDKIEEYLKAVRLPHMPEEER